MMKMMMMMKMLVMKMLMTGDGWFSRVPKLRLPNYSLFLHYRHCRAHHRLCSYSAVETCFINKTSSRKHSIFFLYFLFSFFSSSFFWYCNVAFFCFVLWNTDQRIVLQIPQGNIKIKIKKLFFSASVPIKWILIIKKEFFFYFRKRQKWSEKNSIIIK